MSYLRICIPKILTPEQRQQANVAAIQENPLNRAWGADPKQMAVEVGKRWPNGRVLHVRYFNGDDVQRAKCEQCVHTIESFANIKFVFDNSPGAEIRVAFYDGGQWNDQGSWSYVGTDCLITPKNEQTLNLGWLDRNTPDEEWERVVVHEFLHAIGADHEDQQPAATIQWNREAVYDYFTGPPNNWTRQMVDENILDRTPPQGLSYTVFDPISIMAYEIPAEFTLDGKGVKGGEVPSVLDKKKMGEMYPFGVTPPPAVVTPTLVPGGAGNIGVISIISPTNSFTLPVGQNGTYRIWSSFTHGIVTIFHESDTAKPLAKNIQQVTAKLPKGQYTVTVASANPGLQAQYRIMARRIG